MSGVYTQRQNTLFSDPNAGYRLHWYTLLAVRIERTITARSTSNAENRSGQSITFRIFIAVLLFIQKPTDTYVFC